MNELFPTHVHPADVKPLNGEVNRKPAPPILNTLGIGDITPKPSRETSPFSSGLVADTPVVEQKRSLDNSVERKDHIRARRQRPPQGTLDKFHQNLLSRSSLSDAYDNIVIPTPCSAPPETTSFPLSRASQRSQGTCAIPNEKQWHRMPSAKEGSNRSSNSIFGIGRSVDTHSQQTIQNHLGEPEVSPVSTQPIPHNLEEYASSETSYQHLGRPPVFPVSPTIAVHGVPQSQGVGPHALFPASVPPVSSAFSPQSRSRIAYPIHPNACIVHPTEFAPYGFPQSMSHTQQPIFLSTPSIAPPFPPRSLPLHPEQYSAPSIPVEYDFSVDASRSSTAGPSYPPQQQPYPMFSYQPAISSTPQYIQAPPMFATHPPPRLPQTLPPPVPPPQPYPGYIGQSPVDGSSTAHQPPVQWWYMSSHPHASSCSIASPIPGLYHYNSFLRQPGLASPSNDQTSPATQANSVTRGRLVPISAARQTDQKLSTGSAPPLKVLDFPRQKARAAPGKSTQKYGASDPDNSSLGLSDLASSLKTNHAAVHESDVQSEQNYTSKFSEECESASSISQTIRRVAKQGQQIQRSEWVMWVGNVPSDATEDELLRFFAEPGETLSSNLPTLVTSSDHVPQADVDDTRITSIFLIARSKCAFVNYASQGHLQHAIAIFNGKQLRPDDPRCPRLVCRVRGKEEDQRAGVGGQRGTGMHVRWINEQEHQRQEQKAEKDKDSNLTDEDVDQSGLSPAPSIDCDDGTSMPTSSSSRSCEHQNLGRSFDHHSSSSASTTSSFLSRHFPKRYFIMKSLTQYDLDLSVSRAIWATQSHNQSVLNQAYRTSKDVYLIFSVNKSGEFFGYARMAGPIERTEERVVWASRSNSHLSKPTASSITSVDTCNVSCAKAGGFEEGEATQDTERRSAGEDARQQNSSDLLFSPQELRLVDESPRAISPGESCCSNVESHAPRPKPVSAPPSNRQKTRQPAHPAYVSAPPTLRRPPRIHLDSGAPLRAIREEQIRSPDTDGASNVESVDAPDQSAASASEDVLKTSDTMSRLPSDQAIDSTAHDDVTDAAASAVWGTPFKVQWTRVSRLPFHRIRHIRNPWNHDREVKVSRDGTELEPNVGQALLDEWDKDVSQSVGQVGQGSGPSNLAKRGNFGRKANQPPS